MRRNFALKAPFEWIWARGSVKEKFK